MGTIWVRKASGVDVAVHSLGGRGPILLFAPANGFHGRCYEPVVRFQVFSAYCKGDARS